MATGRLGTLNYIKYAVVLTCRPMLVLPLTYIHAVSTW